MQSSGVFAAKAPIFFTARAPTVCLDTRLIAAVQTRAGSRCHRSANLLHGYYMSADAYRLKFRNGDAVAADYAGRRMQQSEDRLREFLGSCSPAACHPAAPAYAFA